MHEPAVDGTSRPAASEALLGRAGEDVLAGVYFIATEKHAAGAMGVRAGDYLVISSSSASNRSAT